MNIQLAMHSSPRFSTWIWLSDWRVMIDAGDGATQHLGHKIQKIDTLAMTHAHRDHIGGLSQAVNQRGAGGSFAVLHPRGSNSFPMLEAFVNKWNPGTSWRAVWQGIEGNQEIETGIDGRLLRTFRTHHYTNDTPENMARSVGYHLVWRKAKVKAEYRDLSQAELDAVRAEVGREGITEPVDEKWVTVGGDGCPLSPDEVRGTKLLLHEATFLSPDDYDAEEDGEDVGHVHSTVEDALCVAREAEVEDVVLYHISTRYPDGAIRDAIRGSAAKLGFKGRVWAAFPRRVFWDLLRERPVWES